MRAMLERDSGKRGERNTTHRTEAHLTVGMINREDWKRWH